MSSSVGTPTTEQGAATSARGAEGVLVSEPAPTTEGGGGALTSTSSGAGAGTATSDEEFAELWRVAMLAYDSARPRSLQSDEGSLGASDALGCEHRAVLQVRRVPPTDVAEKGAAITGTMIHESALPAFAQVTGALIEQDLMLTLPSGAQIPVHPDICWADDTSVTDLKTVNDINLRRNLGPEDKHRAQVHLYALACLQNGLVTDEPLVRILYVSRENVLDTFVFSEPFSMDWVQRADDWFDNVRYAVLHGEDGQKDANPNFCRRFCGFVSICRPPLMDSEGQLQNTELRRLVIEGAAASKARKHYEKIEKEAKDAIRGVSGTVDAVRVVSTNVNGSKPHTKVEFFDV